MTNSLSPLAVNHAMPSKALISSRSRCFVELISCFDAAWRITVYDEYRITVDAQNSRPSTSNCRIGGGEVCKQTSAIEYALIVSAL